MSDRIDTEFQISYKAKNSSGKVTLEIDETIKVYDQSPESASAHLVSAISGLAGPAKNQAGAV